MKTRNRAILVMAIILVITSIQVKAQVLTARASRVTTELIGEGKDITEISQLIIVDLSTLTIKIDNAGEWRFSIRSTETNDPAVDKDGDTYVLHSYYCYDREGVECLVSHYCYTNISYHFFNIFYPEVGQIYYDCYQASWSPKED